MDQEPEVTRFVRGPWSDPLAHRAFVEERKRGPTWMASLIQLGLAPFPVRLPEMIRSPLTKSVADGAWSGSMSH